MTPLAVTSPDRADVETHTVTAYAACSAVTNKASVPALRHFVMRCAERLGLSQDLCDTACLVAGELIANAVLHSGSPSVAVLVSIERHHLIISVHDRGIWYTRTEPRQSPPDDGIACGRGLNLVEALASRFSVATGSTGTVVQASLCIDTLVPAAGVPGENAESDAVAAGTDTLGGPLDDDESAVIVARDTAQLGSRCVYLASGPAPKRV